MKTFPIIYLALIALAVALPVSIEVTFTLLVGAGLGCFLLADYARDRRLAQPSHGR